MISQLWGMLVRYFVGCLNLFEFVWQFPCDHSRVMSFEEESHRGKHAISHHIISRVHTIYMIYDCWCWPWSLANALLPINGSLKYLMTFKGLPDMAYAYLSPTIPTPSCYNLAPLFFNFLYLSWSWLLSLHISCPLLPNLTFRYILFVSTFWNSTLSSSA